MYIKNKLRPPTPLPPPADLPIALADDTFDVRRSTADRIIADVSNIADDCNIADDSKQTVIEFPADSNQKCPNDD